MEHLPLDPCEDRDQTAVELTPGLPRPTRTAWAVPLVASSSSCAPTSLKATETPAVSQQNISFSKQLNLLHSHSHSSSFASVQLRSTYMGLDALASSQGSALAAATSTSQSAHTAASSWAQQTDPDEQGRLAGNPSVSGVEDEGGVTSGCSCDGNSPPSARDQPMDSFPTLHIQPHAQPVQFAMYATPFASREAYGLWTEVSYEVPCPASREEPEVHAATPQTWSSAQLPSEDDMHSAAAAAAGLPASPPSTMGTEAEAAANGPVVSASEQVSTERGPQRRARRRVQKGDAQQEQGRSQHIKPAGAVASGPHTAPCPLQFGPHGVLTPGLSVPAPIPSASRRAQRYAHNLSFNPSPDDAPLTRPVGASSGRHDGAGSGSGGSGAGTLLAGVPGADSPDLSGVSASLSHSDQLSKAAADSLPTPGHVAKAGLLATPTSRMQPGCAAAVRDGCVPGVQCWDPQALPKAGCALQLPGCALQLPGYAIAGAAPGLDPFGSRAAVLPGLGMIASAAGARRSMEHAAPGSQHLSTAPPALAATSFQPPSCAAQLMQAGSSRGSPKLRPPCFHPPTAAPTIASVAALVLPCSPDGPVTHQPSTSPPATSSPRPLHHQLPATGTTGYQEHRQLQVAGQDQERGCKQEEEQCVASVCSQHCTQAQLHLIQPAPAAAFPEPLPAASHVRAQADGHANGNAVQVCSSRGGRSLRAHSVAVAAFKCVVRGNGEIPSAACSYVYQEAGSGSCGGWGSGASGRLRHHPLRSLQDLRAHCAARGAEAEAVAHTRSSRGSGSRRQSQNEAPCSREKDADYGVLGAASSASGFDAAEAAAAAAASQPVVIPHVPSGPWASPIMSQDFVSLVAVPDRESVQQRSLHGGALSAALRRCSSGHTLGHVQGAGSVGGMQRSASAAWLGSGGLGGAECGEVHMGLGGHAWGDAVQGGAHARSVTLHRSAVPLHAKNVNAAATHAVQPQQDTSCGVAGTGQQAGAAMHAALAQAMQVSDYQTTAAPVESPASGTDASGAASDTQGVLSVDSPHQPAAALPSSGGSSGTSWSPRAYRAAWAAAKMAAQARDMHFSPDHACMPAVMAAAAQLGTDSRLVSEQLRGSFPAALPDTAPVEPLTTQQPASNCQAASSSSVRRPGDQCCGPVAQGDDWAGAGSGSPPMQAEGPPALEAEGSTESTATAPTATTAQGQTCQHLQLPPVAGTDDKASSQLVRTRSVQSHAHTEHHAISRFAPVIGRSKSLVAPLPDIAPGSMWLLAPPPPEGVGDNFCVADTLLAPAAAPSTAAPESSVSGLQGLMAGLAVDVPAGEDMCTATSAMERITGWCLQGDEAGAAAGQPTADAGQQGAGLLGGLTGLAGLRGDLGNSSHDDNSFGGSSVASSTAESVAGAGRFTPLPPLPVHVGGAQLDDVRMGPCADQVPVEQQAALAVGTAAKSGLLQPIMDGQAGADDVQVWQAAAAEPLAAGLTPQRSWERPRESPPPYPLPSALGSSRAEGAGTSACRHFCATSPAACGARPSAPPPTASPSGAAAHVVQGQLVAPALRAAAQALAPAAADSPAKDGSACEVAGLLRAAAAAGHAAAVFNPSPATTGELLTVANTAYAASPAGAEHKLGDGQLRTSCPPVMSDAPCTPLSRWTPELTAFGCMASTPPLVGHLPSRLITAPTTPPGAPPPSPSTSLQLHTSASNRHQLDIMGAVHALGADQDAGRALSTTCSTLVPSPPHVSVQACGSVGAASSVGSIQPAVLARMGTPGSCTPPPLPHPAAHLSRTSQQQYSSSTDRCSSRTADVDPVPLSPSHFLECVYAPTDRWAPPSVLPRGALARRPAGNPQPQSSGSSSGSSSGDSAASNGPAYGMLARSARANDDWRTSWWGVTGFFSESRTEALHQQLLHVQMAALSRFFGRARRMGRAAASATAPASGTPPQAHAQRGRGGG